MDAKCKKCGEPITVTGNKRGRYVGKCKACKHWGDYGKRVEENSSKKEAGTAEKIEPAPRAVGNAKPGRKPASVKPATKPGRGRALRDKQPIPRDGAGSFLGRVVKAFDFEF